MWIILDLSEVRIKGTVVFVKYFMEFTITALDVIKFRAINNWADKNSEWRQPTKTIICV